MKQLANEALRRPVGGLLEAFRYLRPGVVELMQRCVGDRALFRHPVEVVYRVVLFFVIGVGPDGALTAALGDRS